MVINAHENIHFFQHKNPMNRVLQNWGLFYNPSIIKIVALLLDRESKLFLGKHLCGLEKENQFMPPDRFRKYLSEDVYITQGFDHNLWVLSNSSFREIYKNLKHLNVANPMARLLFRLILGAAIEAGINEQGYLKISDDLREYAQVKNEVLLVGQGDYFEIWSPDLWNMQESELRKVESNTERFSMFEITTR